MIGIDDHCNACDARFPAGYEACDARNYCPDCQNEADEANAQVLAMGTL